MTSPTLSSLYKQCYLSCFMCLESSQFGHLGREITLDFYKSLSSALPCKYLHCGGEGVEGQRALTHACVVPAQSFTKIHHCGPHKQRQTWEELTKKTQNSLLHLHTILPGRLIYMSPPKVDPASKPKRKDSKIRRK